MTMLRGSRRWILAGFVLLAVLVVVGVLRQPATSSGVSAAPEVGHLAPAFTLQDVDGKQVSLEQYRGKVVLINFFATWCVPCRHELPRINRAYRAHPGKFAVLAIDRDEPASDVKQFVSALHLAFVPLLDPALMVRQRYQVLPQPVSFWIDRHGVIRAIDYEMDDRRIAKELRRLST